MNMHNVTHHKRVCMLLKTKTLNEVTAELDTACCQINTC